MYVYITFRGARFDYTYISNQIKIYNDLTISLSQIKLIEEKQNP